MHATAIAVALAINAGALLGLHVAMRDAAERAQRANLEPQRVVIAVPREDAKIAFTF
jgi:hypothetical protein